MKPHPDNLQQSDTITWQDVDTTVEAEEKRLDAVVRSGSLDAKDADDILTAVQQEAISQLGKSKNT